MCVCVCIDFFSLYHFTQIILIRKYCDSFFLLSAFYSPKVSGNYIPKKGNEIIAGPRSAKRVELTVKRIRVLTDTVVRCHKGLCDAQFISHLACSMTAQETHFNLIYLLKALIQTLCAAVLTFKLRTRTLDYSVLDVL